MNVNISYKYWSTTTATGSGDNTYIYPTSNTADYSSGTGTYPPIYITFPWPVSSSPLINAPLFQCGKTFITENNIIICYTCRHPLNKHRVNHWPKSGCTICFNAMGVDITERRNRK